ncbi:MAG: carboxypeptidase-like regulatory domain-containing protein, partial [Flavobacteriales bacterium]
MRTVLILCVLLPLTSFAQSKKTFQLSGNLTDASSGDPILGVNILAKGNFNIGASSDADGDYNLKLAEGKYVVKFSHVAFRDTSIVINTKKWESNKQVLNLKMVFSPVLLNEAVAFGTPDTIYGHDEYNVGDLAFVDDKLLLLTYEKEDRWKRQSDVDKCIHQGVRLVMLDSSGNVLDARGVPFKCLDFYTDFFSEVLLSTMDSMLHIGFSENELFLSGVSSDDYDNYYLPVIDSLHHQILASTYKEDYPGFEYYGFNTEDSTF